MKGTETKMDIHTSIARWKMREKFLIAHSLIFSTIINVLTIFNFIFENYYLFSFFLKVFRWILIYVLNQNILSLRMKLDYFFWDMRMLKGFWYMNCRRNDYKLNSHFRKSLKFLRKDVIKCCTSFDGSFIKFIYICRKF